MAASKLVKTTLQNNRALIYIDGACSFNGQEGRMAGIGIFWPGNPKNNISARIPGRQTNQRAEIIAAETGIKQAANLGYTEVTVRADSHYVINAAKYWMKNWENEGWSKKLINKCEFLELRNAMQDINVEFEYVQSKENKADELARAAAGSKK